MKSFKNMLVIVALCAIGSVSAKQITRTTATPGYDAPVSPREIREVEVISTEPVESTRAQGKSKHYNSVRQSIMTEYSNMMKASDRLMDRMRDLPMGMHTADKQELLGKAKGYCEMVMNSMSKNIDKLNKEINKFVSSQERP
jgi:hypothetical protein